MSVSPHGDDATITVDEGLHLVSDILLARLLPALVTLQQAMTIHCKFSVTQILGPKVLCNFEANEAECLPPNVPTLPFTMTALPAGEKKSPLYIMYKRPDTGPHYLDIFVLKNCMSTAVTPINA